MISGEYRAAARRLSSAQTDGQTDRRCSGVPPVLVACCARRPWTAVSGKATLQLPTSLVWRIDSPIRLGLVPEEATVIRHVAPND